MRTSGINNIQNVTNHAYPLLLRGLIFILCILLSGILASGCSPSSAVYSPEKLPETTELVDHWPHGVFYEIFVMSFYDSDGDGIGDIQGMTAKLDYLQELGVEGVWLMPISPSPSYHKYDVTDYYDIDPQYGTLEDFKIFVQEAHKRGIKVIIDLVVNHSSREHPWFQDALRSKDSPYREWYVWADEDTNIFERGEWGQQVWHGSGDNRYYGIFWEGMPDLNFDHPAVREEFKNIGRFWLEEVGVDGFRLDAAKHIFSDQEKNLKWWQEFREEMEKVKPDVFLVGEIWAPASTVGPYLEHGLHSAFNFDLADKLISTVKRESDAGLVSSLERTRSYYSSLNEHFIDSTFITNHDMNRVMTELRGNTNHAKMTASLLLTLPGSPFIYYGEEIGMEGAKPDEHIREPMLWYQNPEGTGQTSWIKAKHNRNVTDRNVESQWNDPQSLLHHYKTLIHVRRSSDILVLGEIERSTIRQEGVLAYRRVLHDEAMLVIHNLTAEEKNISLDDEEREFTKLYFSTNALSRVTKKGHVTLSPYSTIILSKK